MAVGQHYAGPEKYDDEAGDKVSGEERLAVENAVSDLKAVLDDGDKDTIEAKTSALAEASASVAQKMYEAQAAEGADDAPDGDNKGDDVVDAEFEEVDSDDEPKSS